MAFEHFTLRFHFEASVVDRVHFLCAWAVWFYSLIAGLLTDCSNRIELGLKLNGEFIFVWRICLSALCHY